MRLHGPGGRGSRGAQGTDALQFECGTVLQSWVLRWPACDVWGSWGSTTCHSRGMCGSQCIAAAWHPAQPPIRRCACILIVTSAAPPALQAVECVVSMPAV